jgi:hypothetical protein
VRLANSNALVKEVLAASFLPLPLQRKHEFLILQVKFFIKSLVILQLLIRRCLKRFGMWPALFRTWRTRNIFIVDEVDFIIDGEEITMIRLLLLSEPMSPSSGGEAA